MTFKITSPEGFYPTPANKVDAPKITLYDKGDIVEILIGPATGRLGKVVVPRNGNYKDNEPYVNGESIGVEVVERMEFDSNLEKIVELLEDHESKVRKVVRWFDAEDHENQLKLYKKVKKK